jgi:hypothetical protein
MKYSSELNELIEKTDTIGRILMNIIQKIKGFNKQFLKTIQLERKFLKN